MTTFPHTVDIQTRFSDYDTFGHVNNNSYMAFFDLGKTEFFKFLMGQHCSPTELSAVIVNINVDFMAPSVMGEPLRVGTAVYKLGERSFTLRQHIVNPDTGEVKARAKTILAGFDITTQSSAPLRQPRVDALTRNLPQ